MALKVLMLKKELDGKRKSLNEITERMNEFAKRELDLEKAIEEAEAEEEKKVVEEAVENHEKEKAAAEEEKANLEKEVADLENQLAEEEKEQEVDAPVEEVQEEVKEERGMKINMETRKFFNLSSQERDMFFARDDVKDYIGELRNCIKEKRALNNVGLTIPEVFLGLIRENIQDYSKLYKHVWVRNVNGTSRAVIMGSIPEAKPSFNGINA